MTRSALVFCLTNIALATAATAAEPNQWSKVAEGQKQRQGSVLLWASDLKKMLLVGDTVGGFDPRKNEWADVSTSRPDAKNSIHPYYQAVYDAKTRSVYCLSNGPVLYTFNVDAGAWKVSSPAAELEGLSWHALAGDNAGRVVVVGADKRPDNVGWTRTAIYDATSGQWSTLPLPGGDIVKTHRELVDATEGTIDLVGRIRLAWYRDPKGVGTDAELGALSARCAELGKLPGMAAFKEDLAKVADLLKAKTPLDALKAARAMQRKIEDAAFEQYPVPRSRRNAPLVYDATNKLFVLFGGDHEDYQLNDTWTLDPEKKAWRAMKPDLAPSPRAGHAMCFLPKAGRVAIYEGYVATSSRDYGAGPSTPVDPRQLWLYDAKADRWDAVGSWPVRPAKDAEVIAPPVIGAFYGYSASWFEVAPMASDSSDRIVMTAPGGKNQPATTWAIQIDAGKLDAATREKLGKPANERRYREVFFRSEFCEVPDDPKPKDFASLPANKWVLLTPAPRTPMTGCRQRDWSTAAWDTDREQFLYWGGGHCVRSGGPPVHYSPISNRMVEGYDAEEPYCYNGFCGPGSSVMGRQWIDCHAYHLYAYDPKCKLMVTGRGFLYDPDRMDWLRIEPFKPPFRYSWGSVVIASSPHGAIAWANSTATNSPNLWVFDRQTGWQDLKPTANGDAKLFTPYCDSSGAIYDSKRDRMLIGGVGGGYSRASNGTFLAFDFKTKSLEVVTPDNIDLGKVGISREMAYAEHADWVLIGDLLRAGDPKTGKLYTRAYDCAKNKMFLLDAGPVGAGFSAGWGYSTRDKMVYSLSYRGEAWGMRIDPKTATPLEKALE
ncbi:MAG: kelch repeat-containing protein [Phycisphaerae bacterium]|nr:kelch repeat-containing protein [Phycisphaerae bacterium]